MHVLDGVNALQVCCPTNGRRRRRPARPPFYCQWMPRKHNKVADGLADLTMDRRSSWSRVFQTSLQIQCSNIVVQTDGGRRPQEDIAASSMVVGVVGSVEGSLVYEPCFAQGVFMSSGVSVFQAGAIALDIALQWVEEQLGHGDL